MDRKDEDIKGLIELLENIHFNREEIVFIVRPGKITLSNSATKLIARNVMKFVDYKVLLDISVSNSKRI